MEFFETKVIKVKKEKKRCGHQPAMVILGDKYAKFKCIKCGEIYSSDISSTLWGKREKGNLVNGENLDKIMFPCFCKYLNNRYGIITSKYDKGNEEFFINRLLINDEPQWNYSTDVCSVSLEKLIKDYNVKILKGKILIFEEEK